MCGFEVKKEGSYVVETVKRNEVRERRSGREEEEKRKGREKEKKEREEEEERESGNEDQTEERGESWAVGGGRETTTESRAGDRREKLRPARRDGMRRDAQRPSRTTEKETRSEEVITATHNAGLAPTGRDT